MNKGLKIVLGILFFPVTIYILIWKSKLSKALKITLTALWTPLAFCTLFIFAGVISAISDIASGNYVPPEKTEVTTVVTTTTVPETVTTTEEVKTTAPVTTTVPEAETQAVKKNPLMEAPFVEDVVPNTSNKYGFIKMNKADFEGISAAQLREYVDAHHSNLTYYGILFEDNTAFYMTKNFFKYNAHYTDSDEYCSALKTHYFVNFEEDKIKLYDAEYENIIAECDHFFF